MAELNGQIGVDKEVIGQSNAEFAAERMHWRRG